MSGPRSERRLLFLLPYAPRLDATHGGGRVMAQFLANIAKHHRIAVLYFRGVDEPPIDRQLKEDCELTQEVIRPWTGTSIKERLIRNGRLIASLAQLRPMWVTDWWNAAYAHQIRSIVETWQPDIVQIEYHVMSQYLPALNHCAAPRVLVEYEPGVRGAPYIKQFHPTLNRPLHTLDRIAWKRFEPAVVRNMQAVVVFTERDKNTLERFDLKTPILRIAPGMVIPDRPLNPMGAQPASLLFVGNFIHPPNTDAALRLVQSIFPTLQKKYPELKLYVVGNEPPPQLKKLASSNIVITGHVADITPYLDDATLFIAPMRLGGGIRIKVLEALAAGKAIVATRLAVEGLDVTNADQVSLAESDADFVERISQLLDNPTQRAFLTQRGRAWACEHLGWDKVIEAYESLYDSLLASQEN